MIDVPYCTWGPKHHYYCAPGDCISCACMHAVKKGRRLKFFELKGKGYKDSKETR